MSNLQLDWTEAELLATHDVAAPLIAGGQKCHGGFDDNGEYVSPRTKNRWPAITNWETTREADFGTAPLGVELSEYPENYPNVAQAKYLLKEGVRDPIVASLTRIGTVEGFGAMIRYSNIPNMQDCFDDDVTGTAMTHLDRGLYEAHARDEAGYEDEGGHKQMWFAARDVAFENPVTDDQTMVMLERMGIPSGAGTGKGIDMEAIRKTLIGLRLFDDINFDLEMLINRMASLMLIEISAFHVFAWAEEVLSDTDLVAGEEAAAKLVSYIRADESPHVAYLKTVLSEMRDRTFVGESGKKYPGTKIVGELFERAKAESLGPRREQNLNVTLREIEHTLDGNPRAATILEGFHALGSIRPSVSGDWAPATVASY